jgi:hypothetical protein
VCKGDIGPNRDLNESDLLQMRHIIKQIYLIHTLYAVSLKGSCILFSYPTWNRDSLASIGLWPI